MTARVAGIVVLVTAVTAPCNAGPAQELTVDQIVARRPVSGSPPSGFTWAPDGSRFVYSVPSAKANQPPQLRIHELGAGADRVLFSARADLRGSRSRPVSQLVWSPDGRRLAFVNGDALLVTGLDGKPPATLAHDADDPQWSPDGTRIAYVHAGDLYAVPSGGGRAQRLTRDGSAMRINGDPDWLYSEELEVQHAYAWAPQSDAIAFLSFDESRVAPFPIERFLNAPLNTVEEQRYPLAGARNPRVALRVVTLRGRVRTLYDNARTDEYLLSFDWIPRSRTVVEEIADRPQQHVRLEAFTADGRSRRTVFHESDARFIEEQGAPRFTGDGRSLLRLSWRDGVQALYRVDLANGAVTRLSGDYPVDSVERIDDRAKTVYATASLPTRRDRALVRLPLDGGPLTNLTPEVGWHAVTMARNAAAFVDHFSTRAVPPVISVHGPQGTATTLFASPSLARFDLATPRYVALDSQWGPLDAWVLEPPNMDPKRRYPAVVEVYGGPLPVAWGSNTENRWNGLFDQLLAQHGFIVMYVDGPATRYDRMANLRMFSHRMGTVAIDGPLAAAAWLKAQPYVDPAKIGLSGWSYGGYLTAFTLTHAPGVFASGIAGAPPTDWRFYDSAYTERYMGTPQADPVAYQRASVLPAAGNLQGKLLLLQGSADDNVHLMNTMELLDAFVKAGKQVDYFVFPGARHGPAGVAPRRYLDAKMLDWWEQTLR